MIDLRQGDCLELLKDIPDGSVDLVLADPPYGTTACKWDSVIPFEPMWQQLERIIKPNGAIVLFGSEPFSSALRMSNIKHYKYDWVWEKEQSSSGLTAKTEPLKVHENISVFFRTFSDVYDTCGKFTGLKKYMISEKEKSGLSSREIGDILGTFMASHYFTEKSQFCIPNELAYKKLQATGCFQKPFKEIKHEYNREKKMYSPDGFNTYNPQMSEGRPYKSHEAPDAEVHGGGTHTVKGNTGTRFPRSVIRFHREKGLHPTQKPVPLLEYLIRTYTQEDETVLDFTMGSGSTGVACVNTGRNFIGMELDPGYFKTAQERIEKAVNDNADPR